MDETPIPAGHVTHADTYSNYYLTTYWYMTRFVWSGMIPLAFMAKGAERTEEKGANELTSKNPFCHILRTDGGKRQLLSTSSPEQILFFFLQNKTE